MITAVVIHRNQSARCATTVEMLRAQTPGVEILIVDNDSLAHERAALDRLGVEVVDSGANLGFGGGANVGLRRWLETGAGDWALILPHDARPEPDCLARLITAAAARPRAGLVCAEYGDDEIPVVDPYFGGMTIAAARGEGWVDAGFGHGTFLMLRRECLEDVGLFDESYFAYCEEADLAIRARRSGGEVGMVWGAVVRNPHQGSPAPLVDYLMVRNTVVLVRRHFGRYHGFVRFVMAAMTASWLAVRRSRRTPWFDTRARFLALRDVALGRLGAPPPSLLPR